MKQALGGEDPQTWKGAGPERAAALSLWLYSAVWSWYITTQGVKPSWPSLPWYPGKRTRPLPRPWRPCAGPCGAAGFSRGAVDRVLTL